MNGGTKSRAVLVVDDDPSFLNITASFIEQKLGRETYTTETAVDALEILDEKYEKIGCIVSDYAMVGKTGLEFHSVVRNNYPKIPFIIFTGRGNNQLAEQALAEGVDGYVQKGGDIEKHKLLCNQIEEAIKCYQVKIDRQHFQTVLRKNPLCKVVITDLVGEEIFYSNWENIHINENVFVDLLCEKSRVILKEKALPTFKRGEQWIGNLYFNSDPQPISVIGEVCEKWILWHIVDRNMVEKIQPIPKKN